MSVAFQKWEKNWGWRAKQRLEEANIQSLYEAWMDGYQEGIKYANSQEAKQKASEWVKCVLCGKANSSGHATCDACVKAGKLQ